MYIVKNRILELRLLETRYTEEYFMNYRIEWVDRISFAMTTFYR